MGGLSLNSEGRNMVEIWWKSSNVRGQNHEEMVGPPAAMQMSTGMNMLPSGKLT